jgi:hypothetical protein
VKYQPPMATDDGSAPDAGVGAPTPVEATDDRRTRPAQIDRAGEGEEHEDVLLLREEQAEQEDEDGDAEYRILQQPDMCFRLEHAVVTEQVLPHRRDDVLDEDRTPSAGTYHGWI